MRQMIWIAGVLAMALVGCGQMDHASGGHMGGGPSRAADSAESDEASVDENGETQQTRLEAGQLTAASWDDNVFYEYYLRYLSEADSAHERLPTDRILLQINDAQGQPVSGAHIVVKPAQSDDETVLRTVANGQTLFFPSIDGDAQHFDVTVQFGDETAQGQLSKDDSSLTITMETVNETQRETMDIAFIIDATGSMGDEIRYLKTELRWLVNEIQAQHPEVDIRLASVAYRDEGDDYVTRIDDFTSDLNQFLGQLNGIVANGGGDYPEAMGEAMEAAVRLDWRPDAAVRLAFVLADAPPQLQRQASVANAAKIARKQGIRLYPIGASGVGDQAEFVMRQMAQHTLGRYLFLTDDSGIGNSHAEPHIPCYRVEHLNRLMLRVIESNLRGNWSGPSDSEVIRSIGYNENGVCEPKAPPMQSEEMDQADRDESPM